MEGQKPQRNKGKGKDDYKKKEYRRDEEDRMPKGKGKKNEPKLHGKSAESSSMHPASLS